MADHSSDETNRPQGKSDKGKCSRQVRDLPLERFRLPLDGRKWKNLARARAAILQHIAISANPDGTFERDVAGASKPINYSPKECFQRSNSFTAL